MAWFSFGSQDLGAELRAITESLTQIRSMQMATNDELAEVKAKLTEASTEIPAKLDELLAQVGDQADPALVAEIKGLAGGLADIVPNPEPEPVEETPAEPVDEAPAEEAPVDEASTPE